MINEANWSARKRTRAPWVFLAFPLKDVIHEKPNWCSKRWKKKTRTERKLEERQTQERRKNEFCVYLMSSDMVCACVRACVRAVRFRGLHHLQILEAEMNAATCWHGKQWAHCWDWFVALAGPINPSGLRGISTLLQFVHLISGLSGIQRRGAVSSGS